MKKRWQRSLWKENSLSHHPPPPCAQRTAARELWWSQKSLVMEVEQRQGKGNVKTKKKEILLFVRLAVLFNAKLGSDCGYHRNSCLNSCQGSLA